MRGIAEDSKTLTGWGLALIGASVKKDTAEKVLRWQKNHQPATLEDFRSAKILSAEEIEELSKKINSFTAIQLDYLAKPASLRNRFSTAAIKEIFQ
jgi:hypothetical protein